MYKNNEHFIVNTKLWVKIQTPELDKPAFERSCLNLLDRKLKLSLQTRSVDKYSERTPLVSVIYTRSRSVNCMWNKYRGVCVDLLYKTDEYYVCLDRKFITIRASSQFLSTSKWLKESACRPKFVLNCWGVDIFSLYHVNKILSRLFQISACLHLKKLIMRYSNGFFYFVLFARRSHILFRWSVIGRFIFSWIVIWFFYSWIVI